MLDAVLRFLSTWVIILPLVVGVLLYKKLGNNSKWFLLLVLLGLLPQMLNGIHLSTEAKTIAYNIYTVAEFGALLGFFLQQPFRKKQVHIVTISALLYVVVAIWLLSTNHITTQFVSQLVCINNLIYVLWIMLYLIEDFENGTMHFHPQNPSYWYIMPFLLYAPGTLLVFAFWHYSGKGIQTYELLHIIHSIVNVLLYVSILIGFLKDDNKALLVK